MEGQRSSRILPHVSLNPAGQHFLPGLVSVARQPTYGEDEVGAIHESFQYVTPLLQRACPEIAATRMEDVKGDLDRTRRSYIRARLTKEIEARHQPLVEYRDLAIEYEGHTRQRRVAAQSSR
jgi:hypothetical protein